MSNNAKMSPRPRKPHADTKREIRALRVRSGTREGGDCLRDGFCQKQMS